MISHPTVLVLGAGASIPFGFPSGRGLLRQVCAEDSAALIFFQTRMKIGGPSLQQFRHDLRRSGKSSVDAFLEHRPEYLQLGKLAIAYYLIANEQEEMIFRRETEGNWYEYLFNQLNAKPDDFPNNKLSILTYNYDRSLEHYLVSAIEASYGLTREEAAKRLAAIEIVHLHGKLGELPEFAARGAVRPYSSNFSPESLSTAADGIKIIHDEGLEKQPQFERANALLSEADRICFLGFGYDASNINRIVRSLRPNQWVIGSAYGMTPAEADRAKRHLRLRPQTAALGGIHQDCLDFLRATALFD